ncbi:putative carboxypeptidase C [Helianthus anomalus]
MFYFFFVSRKAKTDTVVIWLTGGPGCGSEVALFYENGPFKLTSNLSLIWNGYGWDKVSNIIFVDQPTGTGFSYSSSYQDIRHDEHGVSNDLYNFLQYYGIRKKCKGYLCYDFSKMEKLLGKSSVKAAIGVPSDIEFVSCSATVYWSLYNDWMCNLEVEIPALLEDKIKLLMYVGKYGLVGNWIGNSRWVHAMSWSGQKDFVSASNVSFIIVDGKEAGILKNHGPLTYIKVHNAGHMVPMDQPGASLKMLELWITGKLV